MPYETPRSSAVERHAESWIEQCTEERGDAVCGVETSVLHHRPTETTWLARHAPLGASELCQMVRLEARLAGELPPSAALASTATFLTAERLIAVYPIEAGSRQASRLTGPMSEIGEFLSLAERAAVTVKNMHDRGHSHGAIQPANLLLGGSGEMRLLGFGAAIRDDLALNAVTPAWPALDLLPFLAPELADADGERASVPADIYALGMTFHALLTGAMPFSATSAASWRHAHAAVTPVRADQQRADVPAELTRVLLKALAKEPTHRYQSLDELIHDLRLCKSILGGGASGGLIADAPAPHVSVGQAGALIGRGPQLQALRAALDRVQRSGTSELVLIKGGPGGGKSTLAEALIEEAERRDLRTGAAKCDQQQLDIPFFSISQVVRSLVASLSKESADRLEVFKARWIDAVAEQGPVIADLVPEIQPILGTFSRPAEVPAAQAHTRIGRAIRQTLRAFAEDRGGLLVFIDDIHWSDEMTFGFLESFVNAPPEKVLLVCTYRDSGSDGQALDDLYERLTAPPHADRDCAAAVSIVEASPLSVEQLEELFRHELTGNSAMLADLAVQIHRRTLGNPYFTSQLIKSMLDEGLLVRDSQGAWSWDNAGASRLAYADNVVDLMVRRISKLPQAGTEVAKVLASIGAQSGRELLSKACGRSSADILNALKPFADAGFIVEEQGHYAFSHDRVLESTYALVAQRDRPGVHFRIAESMIEHWQASLPEHAFEICNQIERATGYPASAATKIRFVTVLLEAACRAKRSAAIPQARSYVETAFSLMEESWWTQQAELAFSMHLLRCDCLLAQADVPAASAEVQALLGRDLTPLRKAAVYRLAAIVHTVKSDYEGAVVAALEGLALLGMPLQRKPSAAQMRDAYERVSGKLSAGGVSSLADLPICDDERVQTAMGLLATLLASIFIDDGVSFLHTAAMVELTMERGLTPEAAHGIAWFGVYCAAHFSAYKDGLELALTALGIAEQHGYSAGRISALVAVDQVSVWTQPMEYALGMAQRAAALGAAAGDLGMACYAWNHIVSDKLAMGHSLQLIQEDIRAGVKLTRDVQYKDIELILLAQKYYADALAGTSDADTPAGSLDEAATRLVAEATSLPTHFWAWLYFGMSAYHAGQWGTAVQCLNQAAALTWCAPGHINTADTYFYLALALAAASHDGTAQGHEDQALIDALEAHQARFATWAASNPLSFQSKLLMIRGELAVARGQALEALC